MVEKDFDIEKAADGTLKPVVKSYDVTVINEVLEIRFTWGSKGTTRFPVRGTYGPLVSAITVDQSKSFI